LLERSKIDAVSLERARRLSVESGERQEAVLIKLGLVSERDLADAFCTCLDTKLLTAAGLPTAPVLATVLTARFLRQARVVPLDDTPEHLAVAMADPLDERVVQALEFAMEKPVKRLVALPSDIDAAIDRLYGGGRSQLGEI